VQTQDLCHSENESDGPFLIFAALVALPMLALAHPFSAADNNDIGRVLPNICKSTGAADMDTQGGVPTGTMDQAHQALMKGMSNMDAHMQEAMMAKDIDVAFVCGMIPHH
jgi:uncharacterized protein (DUF305 family)